MEKSDLHKKLSAVYDTARLSPDHHDHVHIGIGLLNAESAEKIAKSTEELSGHISGLTYVLSTTIEQQVKKIIDSNEKLGKSNDHYAKWNKRLAVALIAVTFVVGLLQAYVIWQTAEKQQTTKIDIGTSQIRANP